MTEPARHTLVAPAVTEVGNVLHLLRVTLEAKSPISVGGGDEQTIFDTVILRDAYGLPTVQGSSIAGVLRHLWLAVYGESDAPIVNSLFG
jgi:CRISPR/Cas system CMR subunit Cmr4 (Cas7 group RAMP superfamily)